MIKCRTMASLFSKNIREKTVRDQTKWMVGLFSFTAVVLLFLPENAFALGFGKLIPNLNHAYGDTIDSLYSIIFWLVTIAFLGTEGAMLIFILLFRKRDGHKAHYSHGNTFAELTWSLIPAVILVWLAFYQKNTWAFIKADMPSPSQSITVQVFPEQFLWNIRYAGPDGKFGTADDVMTVNQLHLTVGQKTVVHLSAKDVIHSFFIPYARVKQDAVPGMMGRLWFEMDEIPVWNLKTQEMELLSLEQFNQKKVALTGFNLAPKILNITGKKSYAYNFDTNLLDPKLDKKLRVVYVSYQGKVSAMDPEKAQQEAEYVQHPLEIACSQLCGLGHYKMIGHVTVETPETFDWWMKKAEGDKDNYRADADRWTDIWDKYHPEYNNED
jgi:heme/copper-type cytochrome/quinol oxidase subunit 2